MKSKKTKTKQINSGYTPGKNVFGDKAITKLVVLERETALQQMFECVLNLEEGCNIEYAFDCSHFKGHEDELDAITRKLDMLLALKANTLDLPYYTGHMRVS